EGHTHGAKGTQPCQENLLPASKRPARGGARRKSRPKNSRTRCQSGTSDSDENDVVLLLRVERLDLQRNRLADKITKLGETLRLLVEEQIDHRLRGEYAELAGAELLGLAHDIAQNLVADGLGGLDLAAASASDAGFAQDVGETLARALARHFDQAQLREPVDRQPRAVAIERLVELLQHGSAMVGVLHVDEVDDDDAAEVAQTQLPRDHLGGLEIGLENGVVKAAPADKAAGIDVDCRHRLGLVDDEITPRLEIHPPSQGLLDLVLDAIEIK